MVGYDLSYFCISHATRVRISNILPLTVALATAFVGNEIVPACTIFPNGVILLTLWAIATIPPTSFFGATVCLLVIGYASNGFRGLFSMGVLSIVGSTSMIASNILLHSIKSNFLSLVIKSMAKSFRLISSFTMATVWSMPASLTLVPRLIFVSYFEIIVLLSYSFLDLMLKYCEKAGCNVFNENKLAHGTCSGTGSLPIILVHGLGGSRAQWLLGRILLQCKNSILYPLSTFDFNMSDGAGIDEVAKMLAAQIHEMKQETSLQRVALIGHSVGGLICSHFAEKYAHGCGVEVSLVVCISTPWTGLSEYIPPQWLQVEIKITISLLFTFYRCSLKVT